MYGEWMKKKVCCCLLKQNEKPSRIFMLCWGKRGWVDRWFVKWLDVDDVLFFLHIFAPQKSLINDYVIILMEIDLYTVSMILSQFLLLLAQPNLINSNWSVNLGYSLFPYFFSISISDSGTEKSKVTIYKKK